MSGLAHTSAFRWTLACVAVVLLVVMAFSVSAAEKLKVSWTNNFLTVSGRNIPRGAVRVWYIEAFCRKGATDRDWSLTTVPHKTELVSSNPEQTHLRLKTHVEPAVEVQHEIRSSKHDVEFQVTLHNAGKEFADVQWFQPCLRVDDFTGLGQSNYFERCFLFTEHGLTTMDKTARSEEARYRGGQVYVPANIERSDVNPRPISPEKPINGLTGCFSADNKWLMGIAWDQTHAIFQGVVVCVHNDPHVGGLKPGETKKLRGKLYVMENDTARLLQRYERDFGKVNFGPRDAAKP